MNKTIFHKTTPQPEKCFLIGVASNLQARETIEENLEELSSLANTAGAVVIDKIIQDRKSLDPAYFIGRGKAEEIAQRIEFEEIDLVIFDDELTPAQINNLEKLISVKVIDRSALILDIFAEHARSRESRTQVELAQLNYLLPRLTRHWSHLSRQVGGIGTKGPGETQLETDRRLVRTRIANLTRTLEQIKKQKTTQRKKSNDFIKLAIVGYTNAGKSTLMNALTNADTLVDDKLFVTLDTTTRKLDINGGINVLLSDTVGFIRKLPHHLIASFQSTLSQTIEADILLLVVDLSSSNFEEHIEIVKELLKELNIDDKPFFIIFNKVDKVNMNGLIQQANSKYPNAIFISAKKNIRLERVKSKIIELLKDKFIEKEIEINYDKSSIINQINELSFIINRNFLEDKIQLLVRVAKENEKKLNSITETTNS